MPIPGLIRASAFACGPDNSIGAPPDCVARLLNFLGFSVTMLPRLPPADYSGMSGNSPVDVYAKVSKIMVAQNTGAAKLNAALSSDRATLSGLGHLRSALESFQSVARALSGNGLYVSAVSSSANVVSAATSSSSVAGNHAIQVSQLAQSQVLNSKPLASRDSPIGSGSGATIKFDFGVTTGKNFIPNPGSKTAPVAVNAGNNSLQGIAAAINDAALGVHATVSQGKAGYVLSLSSPSGTAGSMRISVNGDQALQNVLAYNPTGIKNMSQSALAQNALLTVNNSSISSASNTVGGALPGTTLTLGATGASNVSVLQDTSQISKNVTDLVRTYNALNASLKTLQQGELKMEGSAAQVQGLLARSFSGSDKAYSPLAKIGIAAQKSGELTLDTAKLQKAIDADPANVARLLTNGGAGIADKLVSQIQSLLGSSGTIQKETASVSRHMTALGEQKSDLAKALTVQANALVKQYKQQGMPAGSSAAPGAGGTGNLFDMLG